MSVARQMREEEELGAEAGGQDLAAHDYYKAKQAGVTAEPAPPVETEHPDGAGEATEPSGEAGGANEAALASAEGTVPLEEETG